MSFKHQITATIVIYNQPLKVLLKAVDSFLKIPQSKKLFIVDNNSNKSLENYFINEHIEYIRLSKNIGFGAGHNKVLEKIDSHFHLVLNPDIEFKPNIIKDLINKLEKEKNVIFITPKVLFPDGRPQNVCRKHPTFFRLLNRKLKFLKRRFQQEEYLNKKTKKQFYPEFIHGCFMFFKSDAFKNLNGFDERFFLYLEDADMCRRIEKSKNKILYYSKVSIIHQHQKGSAKNPKLFFIHTISAIKYFLKWGFK